MLCSKSAQLTRFIIVLIQTWDPVGVRRCVWYVYLERYCINKPALARRNLFLEAPVNGLCQKRVNRLSCFFQFDLISCLAKLRHDINSAGVHSCQVPCVKRDFSIYTVPKRWNIPLVQHYVLITLIACGVCDFILKGFFLISTGNITGDAEKWNIRGFQIMTLQASLEEFRDYDRLTRRLVTKVCLKHAPVVHSKFFK